MVMLSQNTLSVRWRIKRNKAHSLRSMAHEITEMDENWDSVLAKVESLENAIELSLWHFDSVILEEPKEARNLIEARLEEVIAKYV